MARKYLVAAASGLAVICCSSAGWAADGDHLYTIRGGVYVPQKAGTVLPDGFGEPALEAVPGVAGSQWVARPAASASADVTAPLKTAESKPPPAQPAPPEVIKTALENAPAAPAAGAPKQDPAQPKGQAGNAPGNGDAQGGQPNSGSASKSIFQEWGFGPGLALAQTLGSQRTDSINLVTLPNNAVFVQRKTSQNTNILALLETHIYFKPENGTLSFIDSTQSESPILHNIGALAACGPWAFISKAAKGGCGPMVLGAIGADNKSVAQFGLGWSVSLQGAMVSDFNLGVGVLFDSNDQTIDGRIVDTNTFLVRPEFQSAATSGAAAILVHRPTSSIFLSFTKSLSIK